MRTTAVTSAITEYITDHVALDDVQRNLIERTRILGDPAGMQIGPDQGKLFTLLTQLSGATSAIEIGTFTGYSTLCIARGLPAHGKVIACDISAEWTAIARRAWEQAGVSERIELRLGEALSTIHSLPDDARFDLAFIDADKQNYLGYYEALLPKMRVGGLILVDNVLWGGEVVEPPYGEVAKIMREFNDHVAADKRVDSVILSVGDGVTLARKRP